MTFKHFKYKSIHKLYLIVNMKILENTISTKNKILFIICQ